MMISEPTPFSHPFNFNNELQQRVHPLSASPSAANNFFRTTSPPINDDVTTIFVVGFPEDMAEREFQNMFTFCPGFEAASLKWHCKDQEEEIPSSSLNGKKQMVSIYYGLFYILYFLCYWKLNTNCYPPVDWICSIPYTLRGT
jgi:hypothetical protein